MWLHGKTYLQIGKKMGLTTERIRQIIHMGCRMQNIHFDSKCGGGFKASILRDREKCKKRYYSFMPLYKCTRGEYDSIKRKAKWNGHGEKIYLFFCQQKHNAKTRNIKFELSFPQWYELWDKSGKLNNRGRTTGKYVMARLRDNGAYCIENVEIIEAGQNHKDAWKYKNWAHKLKKHIAKYSILTN